MDHRRHLISAAFLSLLFLSFISESEPASFQVVNKCRRTVWPGLLSGANTAQLPTTGFELRSGKSRTITIPKYWSGRIWGRTLCVQHSNQTFSCITGDCGSGKLECAGGGAVPPATLAEFTLNGASGLDFYDVSLVDGYNLPMLVFPKGGKGGGCGATGCLVDLNGACPQELSVARGNGEETWHVGARVRLLVILGIVVVRRTLRLTRVRPLCIPSFLNMHAHAHIVMRTTTRRARTPVLLRTTRSCFARHLIPGEITILFHCIFFECLRRCGNLSFRRMHCCHVPQNSPSFVYNVDKQ